MRIPAPRISGPAIGELLGEGPGRLQLCFVLKMAAAMATVK